MPNVLGLVTFRIFPTHMGGQKGVALFYKHLKHHLDVLLAVSTDNQETDLVKTEKCLYPNKKIYLNLFKKGKLSKLALSKKIDVVIAEHSYAGWLGWLLHRSLGIPFIIHSHNIESKRFQQMKKWWWKLFYLYEGWIHRKAQFNFFISEDDLKFGVKNFRLTPDKCSVVTYGVEKNSFPETKTFLRKQLGWNENKTYLLFNGTLDYLPNYEAVVNLIELIEPILRQKLHNYEIVITGNRAPKKLIEKMLGSQHITYTGYVDDVDQYYRASDIFINPISNNTGVKTKLIEAIANNCKAVSTKSGASGIRKDLCTRKLTVVNDGDWNGFVDNILESLNQREDLTCPEFYKYYSWDTISKKASEKILELVQ
jgi:glycosyltransferase involved in cell wall biosynthesis